MLDQTYSKAVNDHIHGVASMTMPTALAVRLMTANGTASTNGTELTTGGGYTAGTGVPVTFGAATTASPSVATNNAAVTQTNMPAGTITGIELWASTWKAGVNRTELGPLTSSKTVSAGDTLSFAVGAITSSLGG